MTSGDRIPGDVSIRGDAYSTFSISRVLGFGIDCGVRKWVSLVFLWKYSPTCQGTGIRSSKAEEGDLRLVSPHL